MSKKSIVVGGRKTSVSLEGEFWRGIKDIAGEEGVPVSDLITRIDAARTHANLSSALRLFVLDYDQRRARSDQRIDGDGAQAARPRGPQAASAG